MKKLNLNIIKGETKNVLEQKIPRRYRPRKQKIT